MTKIDYSKVEKVLVHSLNKMFLDNLENLAAIALKIQSGSEMTLTTEEIDFILKEFRIELKKIKSLDSQFYNQFELTDEQEMRLLTPSKNFEKEDWLLILKLKDRLEKFKDAKTINIVATPEDEKRIAEERHEHKNKRFNVKKGWLPLH